MQYDLDEIVTKLYARSIVHEAAIKLLVGSFTAYVTTENALKGDILSKAFDEQLPKLIEKEILNSELKSEYLEHYSQVALEQIKKQFGL